LPAYSWLEPDISSVCTVGRWYPWTFFCCLFSDTLIL
jgi:hypothetical protein